MRSLVYAVIVAGGRGVRMGSEIPKQYLDLEGEPILVRTLKIFTACSFIQEIVLVVPGHDLDYIQEELLRRHGLEGGVHSVAGGDERQYSVERGLAAVRKMFAKVGCGRHTASPKVLIHDGVRPLADEALIRRCLEGAGTHGACIPVVPVTDTLVRGAEGIARSNVDRVGLYRVQTPQAFDLDLIQAAHAGARERGITATDDASLIRLSGGMVTLVPGSETNLKITTPEDLTLARLLLSSRNLS